MAFQQTIATDWSDLLQVVHQFAVDQGWTSIYNDSVNDQIGIENGNCKLTMGVQPGQNPITRNDVGSGLTFNDAVLYMVVNETITPSLQQFWGHPNSIVTVNNDPDVNFINDLAGSFANVWLYSDATGTYIHCVVQSAAERYTTFSFGFLDDQGFTVPDVAYCAGMWYEWWSNNASAGSLSNIQNEVSANGHTIGLFNNGELMIFVPSGVLDTTLGFTDGPKQYLAFRETCSRLTLASDALRDQSAAILDYFRTIDNQLVTGGTPIHSLPVLYSENSLEVILGVFPDIKLVSMDGINPGQEITFGNDNWQCFPLKQYGEEQASREGSNPLLAPNSVNYGWAIKKIT